MADADPARVHDAFDRIEEQFSEAPDESLHPAGPEEPTTTWRRRSFRPGRSR
jgi:hypothetical protein